VDRVEAGSPAAEAGLKPGDVIVSVNDRGVDDPESFRYRVATLPIGSTAAVNVLRKGEKLLVAIRLIAPPENPPRQKTEVTGQNPLAGTTIANLSPAVAEEIGLHGMEHGVVILNVKDDTPAASLGLEEGDIILSVNDLKISSVPDAMAALNHAQHGWHISIQRGENVMNVMVGG
jgi:serine protease Do